jgi:hypothetical protein
MDYIFSAHKSNHNARISSGLDRQNHPETDVAVAAQRIAAVTLRRPAVV